jgi:beta-mannanase
MAEEGTLKITGNPQGASVVPLVLQDNDDVDQDGTCTTLADCRTDGGRVAATDQPVTLVETGPTTGVFVTFDESDVSQLKISSNAKRGTSATISYARQILDAASCD